MNRQNLEKLATYLEALPAGYEHFNMEVFWGKDVDHVQPSLDIQPSQANGTPGCGTVACAIGHGPQAGVPPMLGEGWTHYSFRAFFGHDFSKPFSKTLRAKWDWMFSADWADYDNTPQGAARRIRWLLDNEDAFEKMLEGDTSLLEINQGVDRSFEYFMQERG